MNSKSKFANVVFLAWWFNTTLAPGKCSSLILQNLIFSCPHDTILVLSTGENRIHKTLHELVYLANNIGFLLVSIFSNPHTIIISLLCSSDPVVTSILRSQLNETFIKSSYGVAKADKHSPVFFQILITAFLPFYPETNHSPSRLASKQVITLECPIKNFYYPSPTLL